MIISGNFNQLLTSLWPGGQTAVKYTSWITYKNNNNEQTNKAKTNNMHKKLCSRYVWRGIAMSQLLIGNGKIYKLL